MMIFLDFDGTLVNQHRELAFKRLVRNYAKDAPQNLANRLYKVDKYLCTHTIYDRRLLFRLHKKYFPDRSLGELCKVFWNEVKKSQKPLKGCRRTLSILGKQGHTFVCATDTDGLGGNKHHRVMDPKLQLSHFFGKRVYIGSEKGVPPKGDRRFIDYMLRDLKIHDEDGKRNCVMVGDKVNSDLLPAASVGISSVLVHNPEYKGKWPVTVRSLDQLPKVIDSLQVSIFVSYSYKDKSRVKKIEEGLEGTKARFWRDTRDIVPGERLVPKISDVIRTQKATLIVLTENSIESDWVKFEISQAVYYEITQQKRVFVVLSGKVKNSDIPGPLVGLAYVDLRGRNFNAGIQRLRKVINILV